MRPEYPGFYYDEEKNRYIQIEGPSASSSTTKRKPDPKPVEETNYQKRTKLKALRLLYSRELNGNVIPLHKKMSNFKEEIQKTQASSPLVWRYGSIQRMGDAALKLMQVDVQTSVGLNREKILVAGSPSGCLNVLRVSKPKQLFDGVSEFVPVSLLPPKEDGAEEREAPWHMFRWEHRYMPLYGISSIELIGSCDTSESSHSIHRALITTQVSRDRDSVFILDVTASEMNILTPLKLRVTAEMNILFWKCTIWTTACNISGSHAAFGTNSGAALVDLETGSGSDFLQSTSDVFALQFHQSGNIVHCGLKN